MSADEQPGVGPEDSVTVARIKALVEEIEGMYQGPQGLHKPGGPIDVRHGDARVLLDASLKTFKAVLTAQWRWVRTEPPTLHKPRGP